MRLSHARRAMSVRFDDPNLVSCGGLAAVMALATRCGLATLLTERVRASRPDRSPPARPEPAPQRRPTPVPARPPAPR